jgi:DNA (cytosine-5)-methyltransferase 3A
MWKDLYLTYESHILLNNRKEKSSADSLMNVLSLFDGISCARVALDRAGIKVSKYYACEIEKNAIKVSQKNYPQIVQLGDVRNVHTLDEAIHLLIGGSPCTDLSIAKKDRQGLEGEHSSLFWEYVRILNHIKPKYFILENVASMSKKDKAIITETLGVEPVMIDAALVSAQSRKRLFWTNIPVKDLPADRGILLKDILQPDAEVDEDMTVKGKSFCLTASYHKVGENDNEYNHNKEKKQRTMVMTNEKAEKARKKNGFVQIGYIGAENHCKVGGQAMRVYDSEGKSTTSGVGLYKIGHIGNDDAQANRVYDPAGKSCTLQANGGGLGAKTGLYAIGRDVGRRLNANGHREDNNKDIPIQRRIELREDEKCGTLTSVQKDNMVVQLTDRHKANLRDQSEKAHCLTSTNYKGSQANGTTLVETEMRIRKLTPIECERLQSLPDNYTEGVAKTHRYKCLGNAFNVEVIRHILNAIPDQHFVRTD